MRIGSGEQVEPPDAGMDAGDDPLPDMRPTAPHRHDGLDPRPEATPAGLAPSQAVTLIEAAATLGVTPDTLRQQIANGKLQAVKHGRDWWVEPAEVERYRLENRRG